MNRAICLESDDWCGIYLDGVLQLEGHRLTDGTDLFFLVFAEKHGLHSSDFKFDTLSSEDNQMAHELGGYPVKLTDFNGKYYL